ncbi:hypothetical protein CRG98_011712 [Punica granatum]|uniref:Reverse transcriptase Ty1/copia-type domain-containing protein n=1 Tax=Punica granatum TaxID=22663 RepID=A0A2I0KJZ4_PUNGR|nr:hypothetical protein CRG98_011712 [Punica granatum]
MTYLASSRTKLWLRFNSSSRRREDPETSMQTQIANPDYGAWAIGKPVTETNKSYETRHKCPVKVLAALTAFAAQHMTVHVSSAPTAFTAIPAAPRLSRLILEVGTWYSEVLTATSPMIFLRPLPIYISLIYWRRNGTPTREPLLISLIQWVQDPANSALTSLSPEYSVDVSSQPCVPALVQSSSQEAPDTSIALEQPLVDDLAAYDTPSLVTSDSPPTTVTSHPMVTRLQAGVRKPNPSKWVFKPKLKADGKLDRLKARLVAEGFHQEAGVDFLETFS